MYKVIGVDGKEYGPITLEQLKEWARSGRVNGQSRVQKQGAAEWRTAVDHPELAALFQPSGTPAGSAAPGSSSPMAVAAGAVVAKPAQGLAVASFVLGLVSIVLCMFALTGIPAVICGHIARRRLAKDLTQKGGGLALAGLLLGYASLVLMLVVPALVIPALAKAKQHAREVKCANNMKQIGLAFHMWAMDHSDQFPFEADAGSGGTAEFRALDANGSDANPHAHLRALGSYLQATEPLVCPSDKVKQPAAGYDSLQAINITYELHTGHGVSLSNSAAVLLTCPIHQNILRADGSIIPGGRGTRTSTGEAEASPR